MYSWIRVFANPIADLMMFSGQDELYNNPVVKVRYTRESSRARLLVLER